jgi:hypothetical protein
VQLVIDDGTKVEESDALLSSVGEAADQTGLDATPDGGQTTTDDTDGDEQTDAETETPVPDDAEGSAADARRLAKWVADSKQELPETKVVKIATDRLEDTTPARARTLIDKATSEGLLIETSDGYKGNL